MIIRAPTVSDIEKTAADLRMADVEEIAIASGGADLLERLRFNVAQSDAAYVALADGEPVILGGIAVREPLGIIWAVGTFRVNRHVRDVVAQSSPIIRECFDRFPQVSHLANFSLAANTLHQRWLRWAGATLFPAKPLGPQGELFVPFWFERSRHV